MLLTADVYARSASSQLLCVKVFSLPLLYFIGSSDGQFLELKKSEEQYSVSVSREAFLTGYLILT